MAKYNNSGPVKTQSNLTKITAISYSSVLYQYQQMFTEITHVCRKKRTF